MGILCNLFCLEKLLENTHEDNGTRNNCTRYKDGRRSPLDCDHKAGLPMAMKEIWILDVRYACPRTNQIEDLQAGSGQHLLNTQVDQLLQAMASFSQQSGLTWDQALDQRPQDVQGVFAASWH